MNTPSWLSPVAKKIYTIATIVSLVTLLGNDIVAQNTGPSNSYLNSKELKNIDYNINRYRRLYFNWESTENCKESLDNESCESCEKWNKEKEERLKIINNPDTRIDVSSQSKALISMMNDTIEKHCPESKPEL